MNKTSGVWGTYLGKIIALFLVLAFALGTVGVCMIYERHKDVVIDLEELPENSRTVKVDEDEITVKFKLNKQGYCFSDYEVYRKDEGDVVLKLFASLTPGDYSKDADGYYTIKMPKKKKDKTISLEGEDGVVESFYTINDDK